MKKAGDTKRYSAREAAKLLGVPLERVRSYARAGLGGAGPRARPDRFSFQDLVLLRTASSLEAARVPPRRIRHVLALLRRQFPPDRSLSEFRLLPAGDRILVSDGGPAWDPESGQLVLGLDLPETVTESDLAQRNDPGPRLTARGAPLPAADADDWYERGLNLEPYAPEAALAAYRRALALDPRHPDAHVNLGRMLHERAGAARAEPHYREALRAEPCHAIAAYNLAIALEDLGRPSDAIRAYRRALRADPELADAHFNLSRLYEHRCDRPAAIRHLQTYQRLTRGWRPHRPPAPVGGGRSAPLPPLPGPGP